MAGLLRNKKDSNILQVSRSLWSNPWSIAPLIKKGEKMDKIDYGKMSDIELKALVKVYADEIKDGDLSSYFIEQIRKITTILVGRLNYAGVGIN